MKLTQEEVEGKVKLAFRARNLLWAEREDKRPTKLSNKLINLLQYARTHAFKTYPQGSC